jgi:hypothetical protein
MAYLGKYPTGAHADEARKSLPKAQRTMEGCLLRYPGLRRFAWTGKCSDGLAVGVGALKWATQSGAAGTVEGRGTLNNGIMVGRWNFDVSLIVAAPNSIAKRVIDFDPMGNVSRLQRFTRQDGASFVGETNASSEIYIGVPHGTGTFTLANGDQYRGQFLNDKRHGTGVFTYKDNSRFKKLTGRWVDGRIEGIGTLEFTDGSALSGYFKRGTSGFDGIVKKLRADGSVAETQLWRDGKPEGSQVSPIKGF